ncbi:MAG: DUF885 family protein, partial [Armatimonadetes bacterium]|nr:DUF885 family protein [Armatimonadota bacterium]
MTIKFQMGSNFGGEEIETPTSNDGGMIRETLHSIAREYYDWQNAQYPVVSSDQGLHSWDGKLTDYSPPALESRRAHVSELLNRIKGMKTDRGDKESLIDCLLFKAQLEAADFWERMMDFPSTDPQTYVSECSNAIFSLLKKEYAPPEARARAAISRLRLMPRLLEQARENLAKPVRLYAELACSAARAMGPLFHESLLAIARALPASEKHELAAAREEALDSLEQFASWLEGRLNSMEPFSPMGDEKYGYLLSHVYLLPMDWREVESLGKFEVARYRALEAWLPDPKMADPDPLRCASVPKGQQEFLEAYESREAEIIAHLREKK